MRPAAPVAALLLGLLLTGCGAQTDAGPAAPRLAASAQAGPQSPAPAPSRLVPVPAPGAVGRAEGPFDDRFQLTGARLADGAVSALVQVTPDVGGLVVLEVQADFYDGAGRLLGSARSSYTEGDGGTKDTAREAETGRLAVRVPADPAWRERAVSAVLSVPVLVDE